MTASSPTPPTTGVAVTAVGAVTAAGTTVAALFDDMLAARAHRTETVIPLVANPLPVPAGQDDGSRPVTAAHVTDPLDLTEAVGARAARALSRDSRLLMRAMDATGISAAPAPDTTAVVLGTLGAGRNEYLAIHRASGTTHRPVNPVWGPQSGYNAAAAQLSIHLKAYGPNLTLSSGATSGLDAVVTGAEYIADGRCEAVVAAGMDTLSAAVDSTATPAKGAVPAGEAAAVLVLRPAPVEDALAYVRGAGQTTALTSGASRTGTAGAGADLDGAQPSRVTEDFESVDPTEAADAQELTEAARAALREALEQAGRTASAIGLVVLASSGDRAVVRAEQAAVSAELGADVPTCNPTATTGRTGGADGSLAVVVAVEALRRGVVPSPGGARIDGPLALCLCLDRGGSVTAVLVESAGAVGAESTGADLAGAA
ncbi:hypothetical protein HUT18_14945 [Streptomyces sp. NA04227]|uniref:beta-ketoacyl synthase N-terminal-like domain-containing protein n=1 Tax=Streptomyces sp. NA04227 TaxID=2742136 RepID=UPI000A209617|nr:beta-ketoacyl synthase N-terminal-like domain-containing protein [Streptomyces sp. NA04227]ARM20261.1 SauD [Streptomyces sp.]QKW07487.1 hypothetical protein HUT18_14945 [Streptomyces sp. NA04227]